MQSCWDMQGRWGMQGRQDWDTLGRWDVINVPRSKRDEYLFWFNLNNESLFIDYLKLQNARNCLESYLLETRNAFQGLLNNINEYFENVTKYIDYSGCKL